MSTDNRIVADLAIVGRTSRARPRTLAHTLRQLAAPRANASPALSALYAARVARIWSGIALLLGVAAHHPVFGTTTFMPRGGNSYISSGARMSAYELGFLLGGIAAAVYVAVRLFLRRRPVSREAFDRLDRWSVALSIAAPLALAVFIGYLRILVGDRPLNALYTEGFVMDSWEGRSGVYAAMGGVIIASLVVGFVASRLVRHERWSKPRVWVGGLGLVGLAATGLVAFHYELGPIVYGLLTPFTRNEEIRVAILVMGCLSLTAILSTLVLSRRRDELHALDCEPPALDRSQATHANDTHASRILGDIYAVRLARICSGGVLLFGVLLHFLLLAFTHFEAGDDHTLVKYFQHLDATGFAFLLGTLAAATYIVVWRAAKGRQTRRVVDRLDRWSLAIGIAAPVVFVMSIGLLRAVLGDVSMHYLLVDQTPEVAAVSLEGSVPYGWWSTHRTWSIAAFGCVIASSSLLALVASRWSTPRRWVGLLGLAGFSTTIIVGLQYDMGPLHHAMLSFVAPDAVLRSGLLVSGGLSLLAMVSTFALLRRRRELRAVDREQATLDERVLQRDERLAR
jgi:hypothetical protein